MDAMIKITYLTDGYYCDTCGNSYSEGFRVEKDGDLIIDMEPVAHCYSGVSYSDEDLIRALIRYYTGTEEVEFDFKSLADD